jgi:hypothetical protein
MATDKETAEIPTKWRYLSNAALALCIAFGAFCGLVLFAIGEALAGIGAGLAGSSYGGPKLLNLLELFIDCGVGALLGSLPGFGLWYWIRKGRRVDPSDHDPLS